MERILSPERISTQIGTLAVEILYFFMAYMPQRDQVEKKEKFDIKHKQIFDGNIRLASFCFAHLVVSERCRRLTNLRYGAA